MVEVARWRPGEKMVSTVLLDFGGTLDGEGSHWLDRFLAIYAGCGMSAIQPSRIKEAFYEADRLLESDPTIGSCGFEEMMRRHAAWQVRHLGLDNSLVEKLSGEFAKPAVLALRGSRTVLEQLRGGGWRLGVVSNFYGNVEALCREAGIAPLLDAIVDSAVVGYRKPDPRIYLEALHRLGAAPGEAAMVGDSFERDIRPAAGLGMRTFWLAPGRAAACPDPSIVDGVLEKLADLPAHLAACGRPA